MRESLSGALTDHLAGAGELYSLKAPPIHMSLSSIS